MKYQLYSKETVFLTITVLAALLLGGCDNPVTLTQNLPNVPSNISLLTPQTDDISETFAQLTGEGNSSELWYITKAQIYSDHYLYSLNYQQIGSNYRHYFFGQALSVPSYYGWKDLKFARNTEFFVFSSINLRIINNYSPPGNTLVMVPASEPRISPNSDWIAYTATYPFSPPDNVYIVTQQGDYIGPKIQITHSENTPPGFEYYFTAVCWLSAHELVIKRKRNHYYGDYEQWDYDMQKYDIDNPDAQPVTLTTVENGEDQPMGYSEFINQEEGWYIDGFGDVQAGYANLFKCPLGVAGDWGQQLTFGGDWDTPTYLSNDGKRLLFIRAYRKGSHFLTGASDVYMMDFGSGTLEDLTAKKDISLFK